MPETNVDPIELAWGTAREHGRELRPDPYVPSIVADGVLRTLSPAPADNLLHRSGATTWAWWPGQEGQVVAMPEGSGWVLDGVIRFVPGAEVAERLLVATDADDFLIDLRTEGVSLEAIETLDSSRGLADVRLSGLTVGSERRIARTPDSDRRKIAVAVNLSLAETIGAMEHLFARGLEYAKERVAFGRPIGSFQSVKHALVDASLLLETSIALAGSALNGLTVHSADSDELGHIAKSYVSRAGIELAHIVWQTLGGIAYMWDDEFHRYLRRITADAVAYGDAAWHNTRIAELHGFTRRAS